MPGAGKLAENMEAAGINRHSIDEVVFSHTHPIISGVCSTTSMTRRCSPMLPI
jgi:hypothetical protein